MLTRRRWSWSRTDGRALEGLALAALLVAVAFAVVQPLVAVATGGPVTTQVLLDPDAAGVTGSVPGAEVLDLTATVRLSDPGVGASLALALPTVLGGLLVAAGAGLVLRMARSLRLGEPLTVANVRRLVALALLVGVGGMVVQLVSLAASVGAAGVGGPVVAGGTLSFLPLLAMLPLAALAEVFRRGARAVQDTQGLV